MDVLEPQLKALEDRVQRWKGAGAPTRLPDAELFLKAVRWALDYDPPATPADRLLAERALKRADDRLKALEAGRTPWADRKGWVVRAYRSRVDGSVQPYGVLIPSGYRVNRPVRLDVVLHGSSRPTGMSELRFLNPFDGGDGPGGAVPDQPWIELRPLGRVENCYRWAGETDVFEAIEDVCRAYSIDRRRIVLRGMSMGASGTWHLGLKHPDRFAALGPYCGYVDTHQFSQTPLPNFIRVDRLPEHQETGLRLLDSLGYAANAGVVPAVAAMGEKDVFFDAHVLMGRAMKQEGLEMVNLISPGTGHVQDPVTHAEQLRRLAVHLERPRDVTRLRFVTWSLKYASCHWLQLLGLDRHYERAEVAAKLEPDSSVRVTVVQNIRSFRLDSPALAVPGSRLTVQGTPVELPVDRTGRVEVERRADRWVVIDSRRDRRPSGKRPGLQGPIDDAFCEPFLCVRGTGTAWNPAVQAAADQRLKQFTEAWRQFFRGDAPVKDDRDVTPQDLRDRHLILFGDPGSNPWIRRALPHLPLGWTRTTVRRGEQSFPAGNHLPVMICASPLPGATGRYLVLNSGHSFGEKELASLNYLLFPRLGDWAVLRVTGSDQADLEVVTAGYLDESWR